MEPTLATDYFAAFTSLLSPLLANAGTISIDKLFADPLLGNVSKATKLKHLKTFISGQATYVGIVEGVLPDDATLLKAIEQRIGAPISERNVVQANNACMGIVMSATRPVVETFVRESLSQYISGGNLNAPMSDLLDFLIDDYSSFSRGSGNGLVSIAGRMNENLLQACLEHAGLIKGTDFKRTGKNSEGDIIIHSHAGNRVNLGIEVKSHHARERLLRGLDNVSGSKVGAGYFVDPAEFGPGRTRTLLQTHAAAIYMPASTLGQLDPQARGLTTNVTIAFGSRFYRPLEQFATDMRVYSKTGVLPRY